MTEPPWLTESLRELAEAGLRRERREVTPRPGGACELNGERLWNFASNDYLGLANDPRVRQAAIDAIERYGFGSGASALVSGRSGLHAQLERELAAFEGQDAALLFPTGYAANAGTIASLTGPGDVLFCDRLNHASLIDGCRLSRATFRVYRHDDLDALEREFQKLTGEQRRLIVTDSVFSMDGDTPDLRALAAISERHGAMLLVDEAHGTGVYGTNGRGVCEEQGVEGQVTARIGTLSKACGSLGGFVSGSRNLIDWLWNSARTQIFSTALPPACIAAARAALRVIVEEPERRARLRENAGRLRERLRNGGIPIPAGVAGPIIPVILNAPERAVSVGAELQRRGFLTAAIRPPTVPRGTSRLRITVSAVHPAEAIDRLANELLDLLGTDAAKVSQ